MAQGTNIGSLFFQTGVDFSGFKRDAKKGQSAMSGLFNPAIIGTAALGAAMVKLGSEALDFSRKYETAFAEVQTISQSARENAEEMSAAILKMTTEIPVGAIDSTKALYQIGSAGFDGAEAMSVLEISAKAAVAGVTSTAIAADTLTTIINAYGLDATEATTISDQLFKTVELGKTTLAEIGASFSQVASIAAAYGVDVNEALAATAAMTKQGVPTAQAMTQMKAAIIGVTKAMGENVFKNQSFGDALAQARKNAEDSGKGFQDYFGSIEAIGGVLLLTGDKASVYSDSLDKINNSSGSADKALAIMNDTLESQETLLSNNISLLKKNLGDTLSDLEKEILPGINKELKVLGDSTIPAYAKILSVLGNIVTAGLGNFSAEGLSSDIVKSILKTERAVEDFTNKTKSLSNDAFANEIDNIKEQRDANIKLFEDLEDRKKKGFQFDSNALEEAKDRNLIFYKILESAESRLAEIKKKNGTKPEGGKGGTPVITPTISISSIKEDIKKLNDELSKASASEAVAIQVKLDVKDQELEDFISGIQDRIRSDNFTIDGGTDEGGGITPLVSKNFDDSADLTKKYTLVNAQLVKMNANWVKIAKSKQKADNADDAATSIENSEKLASNMFDIADVTSQAANVAGEFDESLAAGLDIASGLAQGVGNMVAGLAKGGDPVQAIAGGLQIVGTLLSGNAAKAFNLQQEADSLASSIEQQNRLLERQIELLDTLEGIDRTTGEAAVLSEIQDQLNALDDLADKEELILKKTKTSGLFGLNKSTTTSTQDVKNVEDLIEKYIGLGDASKVTEELLAQGFKVENEQEILDLIDRYNELLLIRTELLESLTQTSSEDIADVLRDGFAEGKDSMADFADDFENLMKNAILESFKTQFLIKASQGFFDEFGDLAQGGLTGSEIETLRGSFSELISNASSEFDALNEVFKGAFGEDLDSGIEDANGAAGAISAALTEDTATELQGIWNRSLFETISHTAILTESNGYLSEIAVNTRETADGINLLNEKIGSDSSERDTGNVL